MLGIVVAIILFFIIVVFLVGSNGQDKKKIALLAEEEKLKAAGITLTRKTDLFQGRIGIDEANRKLVIVNFFLLTPKTSVVNFSDIVGCELIKDNQIVHQKSATRTIGGALVGGALSGGVGAIIGGLSGGSKQIDNVSKIELKILVRDLSNPSHRFVFFDNANNKVELSNLAREAESWHDTVSLIIDQEDKGWKSVTASVDRLDN